VDCHHRVEVGDLHLGEALVAKNSRIGDQDVDAAIGIHGLLDELGDTSIVGNRGAVGDRRAARSRDLRHDLLRRFRAAARAVHRSAQIVDDDLRAALGEIKRMAAPQPPARAGDDDDLAVKTNGHGKLLRRGWRLAE